jgi:hypothetical protein
MSYREIARPLPARGYQVADSDKEESTLALLPDFGHNTIQFGHSSICLFLHSDQINRPHNSLRFLTCS